MMEQPLAVSQVSGTITGPPPIPAVRLKPGQSSLAIAIAGSVLLNMALAYIASEDVGFVQGVVIWLSPYVLLGCVGFLLRKTVARWLVVAVAAGVAPVYGEAFFDQVQSRCVSAVMQPAAILLVSSFVLIVLDRIIESVTILGR